MLRRLISCRIIIIIIIIIINRTRCGATSFNVGRHCEYQASR